MDAWPYLPVEEEGRLHDPLIEKIFTRLFAYHDWQCLVADGITKAKLIAFHARYKYQLMAHQVTTQSIGPPLSDLKDLEQIIPRYFEAFMQALHTNRPRNLTPIHYNTCKASHITFLHVSAKNSVRTF